MSPVRHSFDEGHTCAISPLGSRFMTSLGDFLCISYHLAFPLHLISHLLVSGIILYMYPL